MILKSFLVEKNLSLIENYNLVLISGENIGLKDELKSEIKKRFSNTEQISFDQEEIIKKPDLLDDQLNNKSLFNSKKVIFISEISEKIKKKIDEIIEKPNDDVRIYLFGKAFDRKSELKSLFEKNNTVAIIPCYQDNHRTLSEYLQKKLKGFNGLNQEIINFLIENSGLDRKVISHEIEKIKSLFKDKNIDQEKIINLLNNAYNLDFNNLRDSCLEGNKEKLNKSLGNIALQNEDVYFYLNTLNLRVQKLTQLLDQYKKDKSVDLAINNLKPKIFWKDKPIIMEQIKKWNMKKLEKARQSIIETEIRMKTKMNSYNTIIIKNLLIKLYRLANSTS